jgi:hypothetical protein
MNPLGTMEAPHAPTAQPRLTRRWTAERAISLAALVSVGLGFTVTVVDCGLGTLRAAHHGFMGANPSNAWDDATLGHSLRSVFLFFVLLMSAGIQRWHRPHRPAVTIGVGLIIHGLLYWSNPGWWQWVRPNVRFTEFATAPLWSAWGVIVWPALFLFIIHFGFLSSGWCRSATGINGAPRTSLGKRLLPVILFGLTLSLVAHVAREGTELLKVRSTINEVIPDKSAPMDVVLLEGDPIWSTDIAGDAVFLPRTIGGRKWKVGTFPTEVGATIPQAPTNWLSQADQTATELGWNWASYSCSRNVQQAMPTGYFFTKNLPDGRTVLMDLQTEGGVSLRLSLSGTQSIQHVSNEVDKERPAVMC